MQWLDRLERRFGFLAVPKLLTAAVVLQGLFYLFSLQRADVYAHLVLRPLDLLAGEWWRVVTFALALNPGLNVFFAIFYFQIFWTIARALEADWGDFKVTAYILAGLLGPAAAELLAWRLWAIPLSFDSFYWTLSLQLAFARLHPDFQILVMFVLPMKMKWLAWLTGAWVLFQAVTGGAPQAVLALGAFANYLLFFVPPEVKAWRASRRAARFREEVHRAASNAALAKRCCHCGKDASETDLRLCTCLRCGDDGRFWCTEDLRDHVKKY